MVEGDSTSFRKFHNDSPSKLGGTETEWDTPASGLLGRTIQEHTIEKHRNYQQFNTRCTTSSVIIPVSYCSSKYGKALI
jgi:hypothetical protein